MTEQEIMQQAREIAELYGAELLRVRRENGKYIAYYSEHGEQFYCEIDEEGF